MSREDLPRIESAEQLEEVQSRVDELLSSERDEAEGLYLDLLATRIEDWEDESEHVPDIYGTDLMRVLLHERGLPQRALVEAGVFPTESVASEVLAGKRSLRLDALVRAAEFFHVPPEAFLPAHELQRA